MFLNGYISGLISSPFVYLYDIKKTNAQTNNNNKIKYIYNGIINR